jgi:hypothetical protein
MFKYDGLDYIYVMYGNPENNKHPLCLLYGILELSPKSFFPELRTAFDNIIKLKQQLQNGEIEVTEDNKYVLNFNKALFDALGCMEALSAGSGTILENGTICINNKSGHFKPSYPDLELAQAKFEQITGRVVNIRLQSERSKVVEELSNIPGFSYYNFTGTCLKSEDA